MKCRDSPRYVFLNETKHNGGLNRSLVSLTELLNIVREPQEPTGEKYINYIDLWTGNQEENHCAFYSCTRPKK